DRLFGDGLDTADILRFPRAFVSLPLSLDLLADGLALAGDVRGDFVRLLRGPTFEGGHQGRDRGERFVGRPHRRTEPLIELAAPRLIDLIDHLVEGAGGALYEFHRFVDRGHVLRLLPRGELFARLTELIASGLARRGQRVGDGGLEAVDRLVERLGARDRVAD